MITNEGIEDLVAAAIDAMGRAYNVGMDVPRYGAAVLTRSGQIYGAAQFRAETRQLSLHAEQAALVHAAAHGDSEVLAIAIVSDEDPSGTSFTNPCGICKQAIYESSWVSGRAMKVILATPAGKWIVKDLDELIVYPWPEPRDGTQ